MRVLLQPAFEEPQKQTSIENEPLVVHQRPSMPNNQVLAIFVHGLGGSRYGKKATWGYFPTYIYQDFPQIDVGMYAFRTLLGRWRFWRSVSLETESHVFADIIRDATDYKTIILVGHSMGGLLSMAAICELVNANDAEPLTRLGGLILMATPQTGSQRVPKILSLLSKDFYALKPHGAFVTRIHETFRNHLVIDEGDVRLGKTLLPTWAILADSDRWVDPLSAGLSLPANRKKMVRGSHTEIVKPTSKEADAYLFLRRALNVCLEKSAALPGRLYTEEQQRRHAISQVIQVLVGVAEETSPNFHKWVLENQKILNQWRKTNSARHIVTNQMRELYDNPQSRDQVARWAGAVQQAKQELACVYADNSEIYEIADHLSDVLGQLRAILHDGELCLHRDGESITKLIVVETLMDRRSDKHEVARVVDAYLRELHAVDETVGRLAGRLRVIKETQVPQT